MSIHMATSYLRIYTDGEIVHSSCHSSRDAANSEWKRLAARGLYERPFDRPVISEQPTMLADILPA